MAIPALWDKCLSYREVQVFCTVAVGLHLLALILADHFYIDDSWRSQLADSGWTAEGRVLLDWLYAGLSFSDAAPNLFPLPLLIAGTAAALALARLARHYFVTPSASAVLVVLPLWYNPFFLQNLSYQYDGPGMALSLAASVLAITLEPRCWRNLAYGAALVAVAMSFYQISLNLFAGLCCVEVIRQVLLGADLGQTLRHALGRATQLLGGCLFYALSAFQLMTPLRTKLLDVDGHWLTNIGQRLAVVTERVGLLITPGTIGFTLALSSLAGIALLAAALRVIRGKGNLAARLGVLLALLLPVPLILLLVPGMTLLFDDFNDGARTLMALSVPMVLVLLLVHRLLGRMHQRLCWVLLIPLLSMLSFAFAYGRVLVMQKELQQAVTFSLAHDINARSALASAPRLYVLDIGSSEQWLPAASGSMQAMPALRYVLNIDFLLLPEMMPRVGVSNFGSRVPLDRQAVLARSPTPLVDSKFYSIHMVDGSGYVMMKTPLDPENFRW